jgi:hypothetical protein
MQVAEDIYEHRIIIQKGGEAALSSLTWAVKGGQCIIQIAC